MACLRSMRRFPDGIAKSRFQALHQFVIERSWSFFRRRGRGWRLRRRGCGGSAGSSRFGRSGGLRWCGWRRRSGCCAFSRRFRWNRSSFRCRFRRIGGRFGSWRLFRGIVSHRFDRPQSSSNDERIRSIAREQPAFLTHPKKQRQRIRTDISDQLDPVERAFAIEPDVADQQNSEKDEHGQQPVNAKLAVFDRPGEQENRLDVKNDE